MSNVIKEAEEIIASRPKANSWLQGQSYAYKLRKLENKKRKASGYMPMWFCYLVTGIYYGILGIAVTCFVLMLMIMFFGGIK